MDPLSNQDPLHTLLAKARPVEPRTDFTQNVMRAIRQVPQAQGFWARVQEWIGHGGLSMPRLALTAAAALAVVLGVIALQKPAAETPVVAVETAPAAVTPPHIPAVVDEMLFTATENPDPASVPDVISAAPDYTDMDPMGILLVQEDTSALTNSELALLLY